MKIQFSDKDADLFTNMKRIKKRRGDGVLYRYTPLGNGVYRKEYLHRLIAARKIAPQKLTFYMRVSYRDGNSANLQRDNLVIHGYEGQGHRIVRKDHKTSKYRGVYLHTARNRWLARIFVPIPGTHPLKFRGEHLGTFQLEDEDTAGRTYDNRAVEVFADPILNFPGEWEKIDGKYQRKLPVAS